MFVGRSCCWDAVAVACVRCAASRPLVDTPEPPAPDLNAARSAIRELDAAIAALAELEEGIEAAGDREEALNAWEDAWLAAGALMSRVESCRDAAASRLEHVWPAAEEPARELRAEMRPLLTSYEARWRSVARRLVNVGRQIARRSPRAEVEKPLAPAAIAAIPIMPPGPDREAARPPVPAVAEPPPDLAEETRSRDSAAEPPTDGAGQAAPGTDAAPAAVTTAPAPAQVEVVAVATPAPAREAPSEPEPKPEAEPRPAAVVTSSEPAPAPAPRRRHLVAGLLVGGLLLVAVGVVAGAIRPFGGFGPTSDRDGLATPAGVIGDGTNTGGPRPTDDGTPPATAAAPAVDGSVAFDLHPIGVLEANTESVTRVIGAPEVVPLPSPFDRSLRLEGADSGLCLDASELAEGGASMSFDLRIGELDPNGALGVSFATVGAAPIGFSRGLAQLGDLTPDAWYRLDLAWDGERSAQLEVNGRDSGAQALATTLAADDAAAFDSRDEVCVRASQAALDTHLFVDNLRVGQ